MPDELGNPIPNIEVKAWLVGFVVACATFLSAAYLVGNDLNERNVDGAKEKTEQVKACTSIEDPVASLTCVQEING